MPSFIKVFRDKPIYLALLLSVLIALWLYSGTSETPEQTPTQHTESSVFRVKVEHLVADSVAKEIVLYGLSEANQTAIIRAEIAGKVKQILADRGDSVAHNQTLINIEENDLDIQLTAAKTLLKQRDIEYQGAKTLGQRGLQGEAELAQAAANYADAENQVAAIQRAINNLSPNAPFAGIFNTRDVEVGDYLQIGDPIGELVNLNPLVVKVHLSEHYRSKVKVGDTAQVTFINGEIVRGNVRYISNVAQAGTNTFATEIEVPNDNNKYQAGLSAKVALQLPETLAIKLPPSLLSLDEIGNIGVKSVVDGKAVFTPVNLVKSNADFVWLSGFGSEAHIIVLGQGFVRHGDPVFVDEER